MSESQDSVDIDKLGQEAYAGQLAKIVDALIIDKQLAQVTDTVGNDLIVGEYNFLTWSVISRQLQILRSR